MARHRLRPRSGLRLSETYCLYDAEHRFDVVHLEAEESSLCISGQILIGQKKPHQCPAFGRQCTPDTPLGTMVSSEGLRAYYHYGRHLESIGTDLVGARTT